MPVAAGIHYFFHESQENSTKRAPVILIHGAGGNHLSWAPQIRRMDVGKIYALDLPGHGQSEGIGRHLIEEYADDVLAFMKELKIAAAVIVGVSMGGAIAMTLALKYPRKVLGLALLGTGARLRVAPQILETAGSEHTFEAAVDMVNENCFSVEVPPALLALSKRQMLEIRPPILLGDFLACNQFNVMDRLGDIHAPALLICGAEDKMTPVKYSQYLKEGLPNAQLHVVPNAGHLVMLEQPETVANLLKPFIEALPLKVKIPRRKKEANLLDAGSLSILQTALEKLDAGFAYLPPLDSAPQNISAIKEVLLQVAERMQDNYPYFHPHYAGQMLKPPHPVARLAAMLALWINPNNHALDGGRASSRMEKEAVAEIAAMFGWETHLGHLTSGGTMANLEALWVASRLNPEGVILASSQAHYTHSRISAVLKLNYESIPCDEYARMDLDALKRRLDQGGVGTVVATIGTTATGAIDPLPELIQLRERYGFRIHADSAYGGYFRLAENLSPATRRAYDLLPEVDSIVVDPHKHGLQPYGCGCILFKDPGVGKFYKHDSPYTYFSSNELHLGEISLECSRAGAAAVGLWATQKLLPLESGGEFSKGLEASRAAALELHKRLAADDRFLTAFPPELDIVIWTPRAATASQASELARKIFEEAEKRHLYLALANLPVKFFDLKSANMEADADTVACLRSVLMKPEHRAWLDSIWEILGQATDTVLQGK